LSTVKTVDRERFLEFLEKPGESGELAEKKAVGRERFDPECRKKNTDALAASDVRRA
jgi:hypothetical protein